MDAATDATAGAVAIVDDLRCEVKENRDAIVTAVRREEVEPLRLEFREALAERDAKFEELKVSIDCQANAGAANSAQSDVVYGNSSAVAELKSKFNLIERKTNDALSRFSLFQSSGSAVSNRPPTPILGLGSDQATFAGAVKKPSNRFNNVLTGPLPRHSEAVKPACTSVHPLVPEAPERSLPVLPPFPTDPADLDMIERAQRAVVIGPICPNSIQPLVVSEGNMARA